MRRRRFAVKPPEMNLVPIMNMVMCLIPVILFGASTVKVGVIETAAPRFCDRTIHDGDEAPQPEAPLSLTVAVGEDGIRLRANHPDFPKIVPPEAQLIPKGEAELMTLYNHLSALRARYPEEPTFNITAGPGVEFKRVVSVLDAGRLKLEADRFSAPSAFTTAEVRREEGHAVRLWDQPVFAVSQ